MKFLKQLGHNAIRWIDSEAESTTVPDTNSKKVNGRQVNWQRVIPFFAVHLTCLFVFVVGWSPAAIVMCLFMFWLRMFAITAFYHRYFSHRSFKTNRFWQFFFGVIGASAAQRGPLWWASHHRKHHKYADSENDLHSPKNGFWWSHAG
jgi:stearoyl-CoA desaturase (delta-9 desaturase)